MAKEGLYFESMKQPSADQNTSQEKPEKKPGSKKTFLISLIVVLLVIAAGSLYWFLFRTTLKDEVVVPYIAHQKPRIDPYVPSAVPIADKLDEVLFDGLFNVSANPSGITYEDGLGELMGIDGNSVVTVRLKPGRKWHSSYAVTMDKDKASISEQQKVEFTAKDLHFSLRRIQHLGSLSPDFILVSQAFPDFDFTGPDENGEIKFQFRNDRIWTESDIKEVLSFKVLDGSSEMDAPNYTNGTGPYLLAGENEDKIFFHKTPGGSASVTNFILKPFIDNSTYATELKNHTINSLLSTPFGSISPILRDTNDFFYKSSIATTFFAVFFNFDRLSLDQRIALRYLIDNRVLMNRFFKVGSPQQRHIANYKGENDNYDDYLNYSIFPTTSYYVEEKIITPLKEKPSVDLSVLPDTVRIKTCLNYEYREELSELVNIMNDPGMYHGRIKVTAVSNDEIKAGDYDAVIVPITGYRSNFLYDLYSILLREPDFSVAKINLKTMVNAQNRMQVDESSFEGSKNFFRIDLAKQSSERADLKTLLDYSYGFMSTSEIGDKQAYSNLIDQLDRKTALGAWLFSLPSLAYFSTQFDKRSIDMYGTASQLSTIEKWKETLRRKLF